MQTITIRRHAPTDMLSLEARRSPVQLRRPIWPILRGTGSLSGSFALGDMELDELIKGIGLKARDSVAHLGDDILFLSNTGVRSLARTVTSDGKMPLRNFSKNIRDELANHIISADMDQCDAAYCLCGGFYLLAFPDRNVIYYMDFTIINPDSTPRVSKFVFDSGECPTALLSTVDGTMWMGKDTDGNIAKYQNYFDQDKTDVTGTYGTQAACEAAGNTWESTNSKCWSTTNN